MSDELLVSEVSDHVLTVTINRPAQRNAISIPVAKGIDSAVKLAESDPSIRAVVLAAAGEGSFCAGADLREVAAGRGKELLTADGGFAGLVQADRRTPWIAAVEYPAFGGGLEICLACDMVVASERASFALPEVSRGIVAGAGGMIRLSRRIPPMIAHEMLATGQPISATRAYELGLINRIAEPNEALNEALKLAKAVAKNAPLAVQASLRLARQTFDFKDEELFELMRSEIRPVLASSDAREGPLAFVEKREPNWQGR